jgi:hypothetical protein
VSSPTQRSLAQIRKCGMTVAIVEHWNPFARIRQDLFGFIDLLVIAPKMMAFQVTSGSNVSARIKKISASPLAKEWVENGHRIFVHGWAKNKKTKRWKCREVEVFLSDFKEGEKTSEDC